MKLADVLEGTRPEVFRTTEQGLLQGLESPSELDDAISTFVSDSRQAVEGSLFFALKGERDDGHQYVGDALERGARGAVVERGFTPAAHLPADRILLSTSDPLTALQNLAAVWRRRFDVSVVGITGSLGKTSVKEATAQVLQCLGEDSVLKSRGNCNTEIGLPLELLRLSSRHKFVVLEMGMYQRGDVALLTKIAKPAFGIVTNVQANHLERTGSLARTAQGKAELVHGLPPEGLAVLNGSDPFVRPMSFATRARSSLYGPGPARYDFWADNVRGLGKAGFTVDVRHGSRCIHLTCRTPGSHNAVNILPAIAIGHHIGIEWGKMVAALSDFHLSGRATFTKGPHGSTLLDDRYNASAPSVIAAIRLLEEEPARHLALLGDMYELGPAEEAEHRAVGRAAAELDGLILIGPRTRWIAEEAQRSGLASDKIVKVRDNDHAIEAAREMLRKGDTMLIKGSRGLRLEEIVKELSMTEGEVASR